MHLHLLLALGLTAGRSFLHAPHDPVYSIASARLPDGSVIAVTVGNENAAIYTRDRGLSWHTIGGLGLELQTLWEVSYHAGLPSPGGSGLFLIGTDGGIWTWDPVAGVLGVWSDGIPADDRAILDLDSPLPGSNGPAMALTMRGNVYLLWPQATSWSLSYSMPTGVFASRGAVAVAPRFDPNSTNLGGRDLYATGSGRLFLSRDGGATWSQHPRFPALANQTSDWMISSLALSENYAQDGRIMLGRVRFNPNEGHDVGEIWASSNWGSSWTSIRALESGVSSLLATPPGPTGVRSWLVTTRAYPNTGVFLGTGVLVSVNGGVSWDDYGNEQDFLMEDNPGKVSGDPRLNYEQQLVALADYSERGEIWYGRQEGLFVSADQGVHWEQRQIRLEREFRDLETARLPSGEAGVFGAGYGVGTVLHVPALGTSVSLPVAPPMIYQRRLSLSPNFAADGNLIVAGNVTLWCWQDPLAPISNPAGVPYWWQPENRDPISGLRLTGFPRVVSYSPRFDGRGTPGSDQTFFWCGWDFGPYRSEDNGVTAKALHTLAGGGTLLETSCFAIAPTYDAAGARTDAYTADSTGRVYKLVNEEWQVIADVGPRVQDMMIAPNWSRPANPLLFVATTGAPYVSSIVDLPSGAVVIPLSTGLAGVDATGLACAPDFATHPVLYLSTFASGVWRLDLSASNPSWQPLGVNYPRLWSRDVAVSVDFASDRRIYVATQEGIWTCQDVPGSPWVPISLAGTRDESDESFQYYQPNLPSNPHPDHAWPWTELKSWALPIPMPVFGEGIRFTSSDGAYATTVVEASTVRVLTFAGPQFGRMIVTASDFTTGALIQSVSVDLAQLAGAPTAEVVELQLGALRQARIRIEADLSGSEVMVLDGITIVD